MEEKNWKDRFNDFKVNTRSNAFKETQNYIQKMTACNQKYVDLSVMRYIVDLQNQLLILKGVVKGLEDELDALKSGNSQE